MGEFSRDELEQAFRTYWRTGAVGEDWDAWADLFTEDADYVEHVLGTHEGPRGDPRLDQADHGAVSARSTPPTSGTPSTRSSGRVVVYMQNRRDHPSGRGTIDFPGITILEYAGGGKWKLEEDFWAVPKAQATLKEYEQACQELDPDHRKKQTRLDWGNGPDWTRGARSYAERPKK